LLWIDLLSEPSWNEDDKYRQKPDTITINVKEYNAPMRTAPGVGTEYWYIDDCSVYSCHWYNDNYDNLRLNENRCFAHKKDCKAVADAITEFLRGD
jgi:hypothetical protein